MAHPIGVDRSIRTGAIFETTCAKAEAKAAQSGDYWETVVLILLVNDTKQPRATSKPPAGPRLKDAKKMISAKNETSKQKTCRPLRPRAELVVSSSVSPLSPPYDLYVVRDLLSAEEDSDEIHHVNPAIGIERRTVNYYVFDRTEGANPKVGASHLEMIKLGWKLDRQCSEHGLVLLDHTDCISGFNGPFNSLVSTLDKSHFPDVDDWEIVSQSPPGEAMRQRIRDAAERLISSPPAP